MSFTGWLSFLVTSNRIVSTVPRLHNANASVTFLLYLFGTVKPFSVKFLLGETVGLILYSFNSHLKSNEEAENIHWCLQVFHRNHLKIFSGKTVHVARRVARILSASITSVVASPSVSDDYVFFGLILCINQVVELEFLTTAWTCSRYLFIGLLSMSSSIFLRCVCLISVLPLELRLQKI